MTLIKLIAVSALLILLSGCGGSSGGSSTADVNKQPDNVNVIPVSNSLNWNQTNWNSNNWN